MEPRPAGSAAERQKGQCGEMRVEQTRAHSGILSPFNKDCGSDQRAAPTRSSSKQRGDLRDLGEEKRVDSRPCMSLVTKKCVSGTKDTKQTECLNVGRGEGFIAAALA
jgi:hypothetical protein